MPAAGPTRRSAPLRNLRYPCKPFSILPPPVFNRFVFPASSQTRLPVLPPVRRKEQTGGLIIHRHFDAVGTDKPAVFHRVAMSHTGKAIVLLPPLRACSFDQSAVGKHDVVAVGNYVPTAWRASARSCGVSTRAAARTYRGRPPPEPSPASRPAHRPKAPSRRHRRHATPFGPSTMPDRPGALSFQPDLCAAAGRISPPRHTAQPGEIPARLPHAAHQRTVFPSSLGRRSTVS